MATVTEQPGGKRKPGPEPPGEPAPARKPSVPEPPRRRLRLVGGAYLLAPIAAVLAGLLAVAAVVLAIALNLGSGAIPPATGAANLVPANVLLYLHLSTDPSRPAVRQAMARVRRFPDAPLLEASVASRLDALLAGSGRAGVDFASQVRPWLGREAAFSALNTPGSAAATLIVLDVRSRVRARAFLMETGALPDGVYRRVPLLRQPSGTVLAFVGHYLVLGQRTSVASAIDVADGGAPSLAAGTVYQQAAAGEPADRVLDFYASAAGVRRALAPHRGLLGALGTLLDQPALSAVTVSVSPSAAGLNVQVHSATIPKLAAASKRRAASFVAQLPSALPAGSALLLDVGDLRRGAPKLLAVAARVGIAGRAASALGQLGAALSAQGVNLGRVFSIFGHEVALAVVPGRDGAGPALAIVGLATDPAAARRQLGALEGPLTQAFAPPSNGAGVAPEVVDTLVRGVTVSQLKLAPGLQLDWAVARGLVVVSTSLGGVADVLTHRAALSDEHAYRTALGVAPGQVTSLVFFDLAPLLRLGDQTGLIGSSVLAALRPDLEQIRAIGLDSVGGESDTTTQLQLQLR